MMPCAVEHPARVDAGIAFDVAAYVESERQDSAVLLKRKQHAAAGLLPEDFAESSHVGGTDPRGEREAGQDGRSKTVKPNGVFALEAQSGTIDSPYAG